MTPPRAPILGPQPGGRWYNSIRSEWGARVARDPRKNLDRMQGYGHDAGYQFGLDDLESAAIKLVAQMDDPETRRMIVDSRQAARFMDAADPPPVERYRLPFNQFYLEFTEPLYFPDLQEPGVPGDKTVALLFMQELGYDTAPEACSVVFLKVNEEQRQWVDQGFSFDLLNGKGITSIEASVNGLDNLEPSRFNTPHEPGEYYYARTEGEGIGWWEHQVATQATFVAWLLTYLTAKGIIVVEEGQSRQVRRALGRMRPQDRPKPWHIVTVDPLLVKPQHGAPESEGTRHSYRYDVRGHLRFGRHLRGDGSYSHTVEWIAPHQRGLRHSVYVPKTYLFKNAARRPPA